MTDTEIEERLQATLQAKARQIDTTDLSPDTAAGLTDVVVVAERSRRRLVALVSALAIAAAATGVVLVTRPRTHGSIVATESSVATSTATTAPAANTANPIAAPLLAPGWMPDGQVLWSLTSGPSAGGGFASQLFGTVATDGTLAPGLLVELQPAAPGEGFGDGGTPVTVRGQRGRVNASKDAGDAPFEIDWIEGGASVRVTVRGAPVDQAVAALDALRPRGADLMSGFDPASAPSGYALLGENLAATSASDISATFEYSSATPVANATPDFTVVTFTTSSYPGYLRVWMAGSRAADGVAIEFDPGDGLFAVWPDGRQVVVESSATHPDVAVLEQIARNTATLGETAAAALSAGAQARVADLPVLASESVASGQLTLHGTGSPTALCLVVAGSDPACTDPFTGGASGYGGNSSLPGYAGSAVIDGQWYVFVAASAPPSFSVNGGRDNQLTAETGQIDGTRVALLVVPDDVDHVQVLVPTGPNQDAGGAFSRPPG